MREDRPARVIFAGSVAAMVGGLPSTVLALCSGADPLESTRAAGTLLPFRSGRPGILAGAAAHVMVSAVWTVVLSTIHRRHRLGALGGLGAGAVIAVIDLEIIGRHYPHIRALPRVPQWLDHLAFGAVIGAILGDSQSR